MAIALHENEESYTFCYNTLKTCLQRYYNFNFDPQFSMTDSHKGQLKAISSCFPNTIKLKCFFHLLQNINRQAKKVGVMEKIDYIIWVTNCLREAKSESEFKFTWQILKPELLNVTKKEFVEDYEENYIKSDSKWFVGASFIGKQKTNNSLESINRYLKDNWTNRESKSIPEFFDIMKSCFSYYNNKCEQDSCMPTENRYRREMFAKASGLLQKTAYL